MQLTSCRPQTSCGSGLRQLSAAALPAWLVSTSPSQLHAMLCLENILRVGAHVGLTQVCSSAAWPYEGTSCVLCPRAKMNGTLVCSGPCIMH